MSKERWFKLIGDCRQIRLIKVYYQKDEEHNGSGTKDLLWKFQ